MSDDKLWMVRQLTLASAKFHVLIWDEDLGNYRYAHRQIASSQL